MTGTAGRTRAAAAIVVLVSTVDADVGCLITSVEFLGSSSSRGGAMRPDCLLRTPSALPLSLATAFHLGTSSSAVQSSSVHLSLDSRKSTIMPIPSLHICVIEAHVTETRMTLTQLSSGVARYLNLQATFEIQRFSKEPPGHRTRAAHLPFLQRLLLRLCCSLCILERYVFLRLRHQDQSNDLWPVPVKQTF